MLRPPAVPREITRLGESVKALRTERGLTLREVAAACDMTAGYLAKVEEGMTFQTIGLATVVKLATFYNVPLEVLLRDAGFIERTGNELPDFETYLQRKYRLPAAAIRDLALAREIVEKKYEASLRPSAAPGRSR